MSQRACKSRIGQATTEYILMLAFVATMFIGLTRALIPVFEHYGKGLNNSFMTFLGGGNLHQLPAGLRH